ncbi:MAG: 3-hydroxyacyl-CoA dehydrogenase NAD-binding domain-containing protein, partial [Actinobacteria bacterium]|nr:3-hydroxyacyl-CoA dehydrogenase NAD-binding domain-containing protein [Actinomycetota bacterium]
MKVQFCLIFPESSNTSSISITELSAVTRPERFIGMHF